MAPFYLKGVAPRHVKLEQIFRGVMPFMCIVVLCMAKLYIWPEVALWLPSILYGYPSGKPRSHTTGYFE